MTAKLTRSWWVCLSDMHGNVRHVPVGDLLESYRQRLMAGTEETLPVALADSLESSQEAGRIVKRQIGAARAAQRSEVGDRKSENGGEK